MVEKRLGVLRVVKGLDGKMVRSGFYENISFHEILIFDYDFWYRESET